MYWDTISSIVPKDYNGTILKALSKDILMLKSEDIFYPKAPDSLIFDNNHPNSWQIFEEFEAEFKELVQSPEFENLLSSNNPKYPQNKVWSKIHRNKTTYSIVETLNGLGLVHPQDENNYQEASIRFEANTALLYMSILAKYMSRIGDDLTTIGTDFPEYELINFKQPINGDQGVIAFNINFNSLFPTPNLNVSIKKIVKLRRDREQNLLAFRTLLLDCQKNISGAQNMSEVKEIVISFKERIRVGVADIESIMKDVNMGFTLKSMKSLISKTSPALYTGVGSILMNGIHNVDSLKITEAITVSSLAGIQVGISYLEERNKAIAEVKKSPFSYLYYAKKTGIYNNLK